jgi:LPS export ABC transporter permease LptG
MNMLGGIALAKEQLLPVAPAIWAANVVFALAGGFLLSQLDSPRRPDIAALVLGRVREWAARIWGGALSRFDERNGNGRSPDAAARSGIRQGPGREYAGASGFRLIDRYVLQTFLFYFAVLAGVFIVIWFVFSFFELLNDMLARDKLALFVPYIFYLTPFLIYQTAPLSVMVATLVSFGILAKHHELVAFRACGVSLYRLAAPILVSSLAISAGLFALDYRYLPETNRRQDAIRDEIKGRPVRSFLRPGRQWTFGRHSRIFYHRFFDPQQQVLAGLNVYDLDPDTFRLRRHIAAERARWDLEQRAWVMENGWERVINGDQVSHFEQFQSKAYPDLSEDPAYFQKEERQHQQMNWAELRSYILDLTQSGFDTVRLQVQLQRKLAFPMFGIIMALLAVPFSFIAGPRGALTGVAMSIGLAVAYYSVNSLFEQLGMASQLTPLMAAWAPTAIFGLSGAYLFLRVRS